MALLRVKDFDPHYQETLGGFDIKGLDVYSDVNHEKIGTVEDLLVDEAGHFRYFIVDLGFWGSRKKVLLPIDRAQVNSQGRHLYAVGFTTSQAKNLPEFNESLRLDHTENDQVRGVYRSNAAPEHQHPVVRPLESSGPLEASYTAHHPPVPAPAPAPSYPPPPAPGSGYRQPQPSYGVEPPVSAQSSPPPGYPPAGYPPPGYPAGYAPVEDRSTVYPPVAQPSAGYPPAADRVSDRPPHRSAEPTEQPPTLQGFEQRLINRRRQMR